MINEDVKNKLGNFSRKFENEKKQLLIDEENRKIKEQQEYDSFKRKQSEMKLYVENKMKMLTGLNSFTLNEKEIEKDLPRLYDALKAMDLVQEKKEIGKLTFRLRELK